MGNYLQIIMALSVLLQFMAAYAAIRLIAVSGTTTAWLLLAGGFTLQGVRRLIALLHVLNGQVQGDPIVEVLGLIISIFMLAGIWKFGPLFADIRHADKAKQDKQAVLEEMNRQLAAEVTERQRIAENLRESEERYRAVAEYSYDWEYWIAADGSFRYISPYCAEVSGYERDEFYRDPGLLRRILHPADVPVYDQHFEQVFSCAGDAEPIDFRIITRTGQVRWINHVCRPVTDSHGHPHGRRASNRDITDRKQAEDQLQQLNAELEERVRMRTRELEASNRDLESFSYSISHELRAPIARLEGFSRIIGESAMSGERQQLSHYAERIAFSSQKLMSVVDSLLQLARLSRLDIASVRVDLTVLAQEIADEIRSGTRATPPAIEIAPQLSASGDPALLRVCLQNLLDNACKFSSLSATPLVIFGAITEADTQVFFVHDNGVGFDMAYRKKLFKPFSRLHGDTDFPGTGVGLAIVQKIIEKHGGRIWAESQPGAGATFFFTLEGAKTA